MATPLQIWQEKQFFLEQQLAVASDATQKFALREQIKECDQEIARLSSQTYLGKNLPINQTSVSANTIDNTQTNNFTASKQQQIVAFRQGAISTMTVAFVIINELKQVGGVESVELLVKLHSSIKSLIKKQNYEGLQVLSSLLGAIILFPDSLQLGAINLITNLNSEMHSLGIPLRVGISRGDIQELMDVDGKTNFIGVAINNSARLATAKLSKHPGLLVAESVANHLQSALRASHWLSTRNQNRLSIEVTGKRDEKFLCYYPPTNIWPALEHTTYQYDESFNPPSKNAAIISYDLPNFSDGDLNQLSQRFRAITDVFLALVEETTLPLKYFYFSPGGDGGVMVFTDLEKKPVYDLAKNFAEKLAIDSQNKNWLISTECRIGLHYGTILLYENAVGRERPTGEDVFIADDLLADKEVRAKGNFVFTQEFKSAVSGGDDKFFFQIFQSLPALHFLSRTIPRYVFKPITPKFSGSDYLASLRPTQLYCWIKLNLSSKQIEQVWFALFGSPMDKDIKDKHLSHQIIELYNKTEEKLFLSDLYKELIKHSDDPYRFLLGGDEQIVAIIQAAEKENTDVLDLSCQALKNLSKEIFSLTNIKALYLAGNELDSLPDLPKEISSLSNLEHLDLYQNKLVTLPEGVTLFNKLKYLDLSYNQLINLPTQFGKLTSLECLNIQYNVLKSLPSGFGELRSLKDLKLLSNNLEQLPNQFGKLKNLEYLDLSDNQLTKLPDDFVELENLKSLYLSSNKLTELPNQFHKLKNLQFLYLSYNHLTQLPEGFGRLSKLERLNLKNNKPELERTIPPEILDSEETPRKILNFLSEKVKTTLNEAKMLIVGEGKVGKTSLVKRLVKNGFDPMEPMTTGINIEKWPIKVKDKEERNKDIKVNIWDFGGQEIMHATHQFFLTKRSLYLLVLDARHDEQQNRLDYWLKTLQHFTEASPIIIVINQIDNGFLELERKKLRALYPNIKAFIETSCKTEKGIDVLKGQIIEEICKLPLVNTLLPDTWFSAKKDLEEKQKDHLSYEDYHQICENNGLSEQNEKDLIEFLHDLGVTLCFYKHFGISNTYVLNPRWITEGVYKILTYKGLAIQKGILPASNLDQILDPQIYPKDKYDFIIGMMSQFQLCFYLDSPNKTELLIPDLLPKDPPDFKSEHWENSLKFQYYYDFLPSNVISRFIVKMNHFIYDKLYWRYGVVIEFDGKPNKALVKADLDAKKIFISVNGSDDSKKTLLNLVRAEFISIHKTIPNLQVESKIPLPKDSNIVLDYNYLLQLLKLGEEYIIPPGILEKIPIKPLIDGIGETKAPETVTEPKESSKAEETIKQKPIINAITKPINILHLSDIHLGTTELAKTYYSRLQLDLTQNLQLEQLQYLVISGDIANKSTKEEYEAAFELVNEIKLKFKVKSEQVIIVPGNHDLNWDSSEEAYTYIAKHKLPPTLTEDYIEIPSGALRCDKDKYKERFKNFASFYNRVCGDNLYPMEYEDQAILHTFPEDKLLFVGFNSAWQIDHHYTKRASINQQALGKVLSKVTTGNYKEWLKIAVWHHPITGQQMMNTDFLEQLAVAGFELCLHGHIHQAIEGFHKYDDKRGLSIIGGGTFGAPTKEQVTGIPLQYNLLVFEPNKVSITVNSRRKEKVDGAWMADARWGDKAKAPKAYYSAILKSSSVRSNQATNIFEFETVKVDAKGKIIKRLNKQAKQFIEDLGNGVLLEMVEIPSGTFLMGSPNNEGSADEKPQHQVTIPALYIGKYQVTQAQWKAIMGNSPSYFKGDTNLPVEQVSWNDAIEFCKKLSEKTKRIYRLPSEAEWEYACRAGTTTAFAFGETITPEIVNYNGNYPYGEAPKGEDRGKTILVGSLGVANDFGLYDMHGNVLEWCQDHWHSNYEGSPTDGSAWETLPSNNTNRVLRGGSFIGYAGSCRCAFRVNIAPDYRVSYVGFRVVMIAQTLK